MSVTSYTTAHAARQRSLPGPRYQAKISATTDAVMSFAFRKDAPIPDTNVKRLLQQVFLGPMNLSACNARAGGGGSGSVKHLWDPSEALIPKGKGYDFNQAMMDFGATTCTARKSNCRICPMQVLCVSYPWDKDDVPCPKLRRPSR